MKNDTLCWYIFLFTFLLIQFMIADIYLILECHFLSTYMILIICSFLFHFDFVVVLPFHINCIPALHHFLLLDILKLCSCLYLILIISFLCSWLWFSPIFLLCSWSYWFTCQTSLQLSYPIDKIISSRVSSEVLISIDKFCSGGRIKISFENSYGWSCRSEEFVLCLIPSFVVLI